MNHYLLAMLLASATACTVGNAVGTPCTGTVMLADVWYDLPARSMCNVTDFIGEIEVTFNALGHDYEVVIPDSTVRGFGIPANNQMDGRKATFFVTAFDSNNPQAPPLVNYCGISPIPISAAMIEDQHASGPPRLDILFDGFLKSASRGWVVQVLDLHVAGDWLRRSLDDGVTDPPAEVQIQP